MQYGTQNCMTEWTYHSAKGYTDPFNEVELTVVFTDPDGEQRCVPAFWAGEQTWRVRYASAKVGKHQYQTVCSDESNSDLHNQKGTLEVAPYEGGNPLFRHGPLRVAENRRYLEHHDGTPFLWLADTWWMGLVKRLRWPQDFQLLTADRVAKGFTVIQIVAGLYPDMGPFDERGANEAGFPWEEDFVRINPAYFDMADLRINWLVDAGLVPCIVGCWGYYLDFAGKEVMKKHWHYLVARYSALPVVWCLAGEVLMPYYLSEYWDEDRRPEYHRKTKPGWSDVARYLRSIDSYHHPVTAHPGFDAGRDQVEESLVDFDMRQTGHSGRDSIPGTVNRIVHSYERSPRMPVINGEVCYEGIMGANWQDVQRLMFWICMLSGAAGHTYGANGIWQVHSQDQPYGPSPQGSSWATDVTWQQAYQLPGSEQLGIGKRLLERYRWWLFEPHSEWVEPHWTPDNYIQPYAAGIPEEVRIIYFPDVAGNWPAVSAIKALEPGTSYQAFYFDPKDGKEYPLGEVTPDDNGNWTLPTMPIYQDWVVVLESSKARIGS